MDRKSFKLPFRKAGFTKYLCPTCNKGFLRVKKGTFHFEEIRSSSRERRHSDYWEPEWMEYIYSCLFECTNTTCKDTVSSSGVGSVSQYYSYDEEGNPDVDYDDYFTPKYFTPHLRLFVPPKDTPETVDDEIESSFSLFFSDPPSSANHIRVALEHLLTHLKIKRFTTTNGRRSYLALHKRIDLLPRKYDHVKDIFFAIKWLGNAGSHSQHKVTTDDVLDAYELMDELLVEIFANKRKNAKSLAKKINKKKGPK
ncbi:MAG: DUF4145 domain-containing protein [Gammaproteobacteria bacterium]|nr:DUF4145 domain-containing protein [Gammaproteobacteria bacterium]